MTLEVVRSGVRAVSSLLYTPVIKFPPAVIRTLLRSFFLCAVVNCNPGVSYDSVSGDVFNASQIKGFHCVCPLDVIC